MKKYLLILFIMSGNFQLISCVETEFASKQRQKKVDEAETAASAFGDDKTFDELIGGDGIIKKIDLATSAAKNSVWVVTSDGRVNRILLDKEAGYPMKTWKGTLQGGHRTYVTKIGLIVGTNGGRIFRIDEEFPEGSDAELVLNASNAASDSRICLTSYKIGDVEYIGGGYHGGGQRRFVQIPIDETKPNKLDLSQVKYFEIGSGEWGYSCSTDQARKLFWSKNNSTGGGLSGIDLRNGNPVGLDSAPNGAHTNNAGVELFLSNGSQSYSMASDLLGNILSFKNAYTASHETLSDTIFVTSGNGTAVTVIAGDCIRNKNCGEGDFEEFDLANNVYVKPMSSLNDGRIVGIARGSQSDVVLLSLNDPDDLSKGLDVEVIKRVPGDAYMYADFTGASIYASTETKPVDLSTIQNFDISVKIKQLYLLWKSESGYPEEWKGLVASIRCFQKDNNAEIKFEKIPNMPVAGEPIKIEAENCKNKRFSSVELKIEPDGSPIYSKTKNFELVIEQ